MASLLMLLPLTEYLDTRLCGLYLRNGVR